MSTPRLQLTTKYY